MTGSVLASREKQNIIYVYFRKFGPPLLGEYSGEHRYAHDQDRVYVRKHPCKQAQVANWRRLGCALSALARELFPSGRPGRAVGGLVSCILQPPGLDPPKWWVLRLVSLRKAQHTPHGWGFSPLARWQLPAVAKGLGGNAMF